MQNLQTFNLKQPENEYEEKEIIDVPLLGKVTAGSPIEAIEMPDEYFSLPAYLIPPKKEVFTLRVQGSSMIEAGIHDGSTHAKA